VILEQVLVPILRRHLWGSNRGGEYRKTKVVYRASGNNEWDEVRDGRTMDITDSPMPCSKSGSSKFEVPALGREVRSRGGQDNISNLAFHYSQIIAVRGKEAPAFNGSYPYLPFQKQRSIGYHVSYIANSMLEAAVKRTATR
jgi:hypothetical protein